MANTVPPERIGTVLRAMAEDLVSERRRVLALRLENRELRAQLEAARSAELCPHCGRPLAKEQP